MHCAEHNRLLDCRGPVACSGCNPYDAPMTQPFRPFDLRTKAGWRAVIGVVYLLVGGVMVAVILRS